MSGSLTNLLYHIVFSTKKRRELISNSLRLKIYPYIGGIVSDEGGHLLAIGGTSNHVHLLLRVPAKQSLSDFIRRVKGKTSWWIGKEKFIEDHFKWQRGYAAFSVSQSMSERIAAYIENQEEHHREKSFYDEYLFLLRKNEIEFNEKYVWG